MTKRPRLTASQHRALALLVDAGLDGCGLSIMLGQGFKVVTIGRLVRNGLATVTLQRVSADGKTIEVTRVWITDTGRWALAGSLGE